MPTSLPLSLALKPDQPDVKLANMQVTVHGLASAWVLQSDPFPLSAVSVHSALSIGIGGTGVGGAIS